MKHNKFLHTLESCWICFRFPFLYPRNRFTDRHQVKALYRYTRNLHNSSTQSVTITGQLEKEKDKRFFSIQVFNGITVKLDKENKKLIIKNSIEFKEHSLNRLLWNDRFEILGISLTFSFSGNPIIRVHVVTKDESDTTNYGFHYENVELKTNRFKYSLYRIIDWFDSQILDRILFIPTYTELDAMESGWRKVFGIQMCEELKAQLKKDKHLYKYRITQIKEKFGYLHWYDNGASKEVYDIISKYEDISWNTCIVCGKPSTRISSGWICPYCDEHFPKNLGIYQEKINGKWKTTHEYEMV